MYIQPVALYIDGGQAEFQSYTGGIIDSTTCLSEINHGVTGIGFGVSATGKEYWIVRNSWGTQWGENGYVRIAANEPDQGDSGICGVLSSPYTAVTNTFGATVFEE